MPINLSDFTSDAELSANVNSLISLSGVAALSNDLGTFTGTTILDASTVKSALQALETALESQNIVGQYAGSSSTFATLPTTTSDTKPVNNSDWAILTADDGGNLAGIYVFNGTAWVFAKAIPSQFAQAATTSGLSSTTSGTVGTSLLYAREDHTHPFDGVSNDPNQMITVGTDGKHLLTTTSVLTLHTAVEEVQDAFGTTLFFAHTNTNM